MSSVTDSRILSFSEKEQLCEINFMEGGPFWHIYTDGTKMQNIFRTETDFDGGMAVLGVASCLVPDVRLLTFELMSNHVHLIASGAREECLKLSDIFKDRLRRIMSVRGISVDWKNFTASILPIEDLRALRNEIVYVNRNAFVASPQYTPYNYPWGGGCAYFNPMTHRLQVTRLEDMSYDRKRELSHSRDVSGLNRLAFDGKRIHIPSFCDIRLGESVFADARSYFNSLTRNAETFSQIAERLKDAVFLTDDELFQVAVKEAVRNFETRQLTLLEPAQKIQLAKDLHFRFNASNQQLRRLLRLDMALLNELFA